jgi:hypothetical protein
MEIIRLLDTRHAYRIVVRKPEGKRPVGKLKREKGDNIRMYLQEMGYNVMDWIDMTWDRISWRALNELCNELSVSIKGREFLD